MKKHAFLVMAHSSIEDLIACCKSIDAKNHDIFLHIDKKWKNFSKQSILSVIQHSNVCFLENRYSVRWGGGTQIQTELALLKESLKGEYQYYHFMSGVDMVIQPSDEFDLFFEDKENEFISFCGQDWNDQAKNRLKYYYIEAGRNKVLKLINKISICIQQFFKVNRLKKLTEYVIVGGSNWCSITNEFAKYIISNEVWINDTFHHSFCCDELFIHMLAYNSHFKDKIYLLNIKEKNDNHDLDLYKANMRYIDWNRGTPYTFTNDDYDDLLKSPYMFARKFKLTEDNTISLKILEYIKNKNK